MPGAIRGAAAANSAACGVLLGDGRALGRVHALDHLEGLEEVAPGAVAAAARSTRRTGRAAGCRRRARRRRAPAASIGQMRVACTCALAAATMRHRPREVGTARAWSGIGLASSLSISSSKASSASPSLWNAQSGSALHWARYVVSAFSNPSACCERPLQVVGVGVGGAVEHGGPHRVGEQRRPRRAELGSVAEPEVADRVLAERLADRVHVTGRVVGADELDDVRRSSSTQSSVNSSARSTICSRSASSSGVMSVPVK